MLHYNLFLDDERKPEYVTWIKLPDVQWTVVKNYIEFVNVIMKDGLPENISFDHDLAHEHYRASMYNKDRHYNNYYTDGTFKEKTGYDAAKFLANYCLDHDLSLPKYFIHTLNPIGKDNILGILKGYEKTFMSK